jgi:hypothetical protein
MWQGKFTTKPQLGKEMMARYTALPDLSWEEPGLFVESNISQTQRF